MFGFFVERHLLQEKHHGPHLGKRSVNVTGFTILHDKHFSLGSFIEFVLYTEFISVKKWRFPKILLYTGIFRRCTNDQYPKAVAVPTRCAIRAVAWCASSATRPPLYMRALRATA